jgi:hypothetical protein
MMMRSNCLVALNRFKNVMNPLLTADSGVTNTTAAALGGRRPSYSVYNIPNYLYRRFISLRNVINGITTTVVPPCSAHAGNINNKLFPAPVGITVTTGLSPAVMAWIPSSWTPRNAASFPIIRFNWALASIFLNRTYRSIRASSASLSNGARFRFLDV